MVDRQRVLKRRQKVLHETCQQYVARRLSEGWRIISQSGFNVVLRSPAGIIRPVDLRNDVETLRPSANGTLQGIPNQYPASGSHYDKVDEETPDEDSTRVYSNTREDYSCCARIYIGGSAYSGTSQGAPDSYTTYSHQWNTNPATGNPWTKSDINSLEAGALIAGINTDTYVLPDSSIPDTATINFVKVYFRVKKTGSDPDWVSHLTQVYVEVDYTPAAPPTPKGGAMAAKMAAAGCI
jgi:hypothetical protein